MDNLSKLIKTHYGPVLKFVKEYMKMEYRVFRYKVTTGSMDYNEISIILKALNIKFEDLESISPPAISDRKPMKNPKPAPSKKVISKPIGQARPFPKEPEPEVFGHVKTTGRLSDIMREIKDDNADLKKPF